MKTTRPATVPAVGSYSRQSVNPWRSRQHVARPLFQDQRLGGLAHIGDALAPVLRNLSTSAKGAAR